MKLFKPYSFSLQGLIETVSNKHLPPFYKVIALVLDSDSSINYSPYLINTDDLSVDLDGPLTIELVSNEAITKIKDIDDILDAEQVLNKNRHKSLWTKSCITNREDFSLYLSKLKGVKDLNNKPEPIEVFANINDCIYRIDSSFNFLNYQFLIVNSISAPQVTLRQIESFLGTISSSPGLASYDYMSHVLNFIKTYRQAY